MLGTRILSHLLLRRPMPSHNVLRTGLSGPTMRPQRDLFLKQKARVPSAICKISTMCSSVWLGGGRQFRLYSTTTTSSSSSASGEEGGGDVRDESEEKRRQEEEAKKRWDLKKKRRMRAFLTYKSIFGDLRVPYSFTIPGNDNLWAQDLRGMKLGITAFNIRNKNRKRIEFDFDPPIKVCGDSAMRALLNHKSIVGDLKVPESFIIPGDKSWPEDQWGIKLGRIVYNIRYNNALSEYKPELEEMGFDFEPQPSCHNWGWDSTMRAMLTYKSIKPDLLVPVAYTIPAGNTLYDPDLWGMNLGPIVQQIRNNNSYSEYTPELEKMGFDFDPQKQFYGWDLIERALLVYKIVYGDLWVSYSFTIPRVDAESWPEDMRGMRLGVVVYRIRNTGDHIEHKPRLISMGFDYKYELPSSDLAIRALLVYKSIKGNLRVPVSYTITKFTSKTWQPDMKGMKLGFVVNDIRNENAYEDRRPELEEMGFKYNHVTQYHRRWLRLKKALLTYESVHGDMLVPATFIIPKDNDLWEKKLWGIPLGQAVYRIRTRNAHIKHKPELLEMGFDYFEEDDESGDEDDEA